MSEEKTLISKHYEYKDSSEFKISALTTTKSHLGEENGVGLIVSYTEGIIRYIWFPKNIISEMDVEREDESIYTLDIFKGNYPIVSLDCIHEENYTILAAGSLNSRIHLFISTPISTPNYIFIGDIVSPSPITTVKLKSISLVKKKNIWIVHAYHGNQDRYISLTHLTIKLEENIHFEETNRVKFTGHTDYIRDIAFDNSSNNFVSCSDDGTIRVFPMDPKLMSTSINCTKSFELHNHDVLSVDYKSNIVVSGGKDRKLIVYDLTPKTKSKQKDNNPHYDTIVPSIITSLLLSDDAKEVYVGCGDGHLRIYRILDKLECVFNEKICDGRIVTIKRIGDMIITVSYDETSSIIIWQ